MKPNLSREDIEHAAKIMEENDIGFIINGADGCMSPSAKDILPIIEDRDKWEAEIFGVSIELLRQFREYGQQCCAITAKGKQCKNFVFQRDSIYNFKPGISDRCEIHRPKREELKEDEHHGQS